MKFRYLIAVLSLILFGLWGLSEKRHDVIRHDLNTIAEQLIENQVSPKVVHIGGSMRTELDDLSTLSDISWIIQPGDIAAPIGNGNATTCIIFVSGAKSILGLRMKRDHDLYHILGFWTIYE